MGGARSGGGGSPSAAAAAAARDPVQGLFRALQVDGENAYIYVYMRVYVYMILCMYVCMYVCIIYMSKQEKQTLWMSGMARRYENAHSSSLLASRIIA